MNPLMQLLSSDSGSSGNSNSDSMSIVRRMIGAAMSGQSPEQFLNGLAQTDDRFKGIDFSNLEKAARKTCGKKNIDLSDAIKKVQDGISKIKW